MIRRTELPADQLTVDPVQSRDRAWVGDESDRQLAESVDADGLLQDVIVRPLDASAIGEQSDTTQDRDSSTEYAIVAGSRRYHAAMEAGYETIPCKVIDADDLDAAWKSLTENTDRRELSEQEIASQLQLIYELVRPREEPSNCPDCGETVDGEAALLRHCEQTACELPSDPEKGQQTTRAGSAESSNVSPQLVSGRFATERQALQYLARRFLGRTDENAIDLVEGHLRTAELPPVLQALFKAPSERSNEERTALDNYGIDARTRLGSGEGKSGTSREIVKLREAVEAEADTDAVNPTDAVLETVGSLKFDEMSEQELRRTLRDFRHEVTAELDEAESAGAQRETFRDTLQRRAEDLAETYEVVEPTRPFRKVDVLGPDTQQHSRWHAQVMERRDVSGHGELVRELYQERLETLANEEGWT